MRRYDLVGMVQYLNSIEVWKGKLDEREWMTFPLNPNGWIGTAKSKYNPLTCTEHTAALILKKYLENLAFSVFFPSMDYLNKNAAKRKFSKHLQQIVRETMFHAEFLEFYIFF